MLTICPECEGEVSSEGALCPHCGFPLAEIEGSGHTLAKVEERGVKVRHMKVWHVKVWHVGASLGGVAMLAIIWGILRAP